MKGTCHVIHYTCRQSRNRRLPSEKKIKKRLEESPKTGIKRGGVSVTVGGGLGWGRGVGTGGGGRGGGDDALSALI